MKKLFVAVLLLCVIGFVAWKNTGWIKPEIPSFTIETRKGQKIQVTNLRYEPIIGMDSHSTETFTIYVDYGWFKVSKDLKDVRRLEMLDSQGNAMKVTDSSGETIKGTRTDDPKDVFLDSITGECGKVHVHLSLDDVVSITRN